MRSVLAHIFIWADRSVAFIIKGVQVLHRGFWLGLLSRQSLHQVARLQYSRWERYQSDTHNLDGFFDWERAVNDKYFSDSQLILIAAAGGGREVIAFAKEGREVTAFDCVHELVEYSRELLQGQGLSAKLIYGAPDEVPSALDVYDGIIVGWGAYIHISGRDTRIRFLQDLRMHLVDGGSILLSFFVRKSESKRMHWERYIANTIRKLTLREQDVELGDVLDGTLDHYFTESEIRAEMSEAGFKVVEYSESPFGYAIGSKSAS